MQNRLNRLHWSIPVALTPLLQPAINHPFIPTAWPHYVVQPLSVPRAPDTGGHGVVFIPRQEFQANTRVHPTTEITGRAGLNGLDSGPRARHACSLPGVPQIPANSLAQAQRPRGRARANPVRADGRRRWRQGKSRERRLCQTRQRTDPRMTRVAASPAPCRTRPRPILTAPSAPFRHPPAGPGRGRCSRRVEQGRRRPPDRRLGSAARGGGGSGGPRPPERRRRRRRGGRPGDARADPDPDARAHQRH
jgi:hypothetical protein